MAVMRVGLLLVVLGAAAGMAEGQTLPDPAIFDRVLGAFVLGDRVDYAGLAERPLDLDLYLEQLDRTSPTDLDLLSRDERLAFWINAFNACALRLVVDHYPIDPGPGGGGRKAGAPGVPGNSIRQIPDAWARQFCRVAQWDRSLDGIVHGILRPLGDPRAHLAVHCAARSCPPLAAEAYRGDRIDEQLDAAVRRLVADARHYVLQRTERPVVRVNKLFDWYKEDFGGIAGVITFLRRYVPAADAELLQPGRVRVEYLEFDWTLDEAVLADTAR
jgi:hypothetical protein